MILKITLEPEKPLFNNQQNYIVIESVLQTRE
jgi:hypothetical protein